MSCSSVQKYRCFIAIISEISPGNNRNYGRIVKGLKRTSILASGRIRDTCPVVNLVIQAFCVLIPDRIGSEINARIAWYSRGIYSSPLGDDSKRFFFPFFRVLTHELLRYSNVMITCQLDHVS
jgi:hypothetical protein